MSELELFFAENVENVDEVGVVVSERFKDSDGKPLEWKLKPVSAEKNSELKKLATKTVQVTGKPGQFRKDFDSTRYSELLTAATVVFPDLQDADLQDSWSKKVGERIFDAERLLRVMLLSGEFDNLTAKVTEINGYNNINEKVDEAKN